MWWGGRTAQAVRGVLLAGSAALLVSACTVTNPLGTSSLGPPLPVIAHEAVADYQGARSVAIRGSYLAGSAPVTVRVSMQPSGNGRVSGRATYKGDPLDVVGDGGRVFTKGLRYWQSEGAQGLRIWPQFGAGWVLAPSRDPGAEAISAAGDLGGLLGRLERRASSLVSQGTRSFDGQEIASLRDGNTTYDVTTSTPYRLLGVRSAGTTPSSDGLHQINLRISYGGRLKVALPATGTFVDPRDATTFPALFEVQSISDLQSCDESSCGFSATLVNTTGKELGQVTATLALFEDPQHTESLGSCTAPVPQVATSQTTTVTCRIDSQAYQTFFAEVFGNVTIYRHVTIQNPPYA